MNFTTPGYEDLELSTQILIKEALKRDIEVQVVDRKDNFIQLQKGKKIEYIKQATMTSADTYIAPLIMGNKMVTKSILSLHGIRVPYGKVASDIGGAIQLFHEFAGKDIVIKPNSTNFGIAVTIIENNQSRDDYEKGVREAFEHDISVIIEEFIRGKEYRFLIAGDEVIAILHRVAANVTGDGIHTIGELIDEKNNSPLRGEGYTKPLEKIKMGTTEDFFLKLQGKNFSTIPKNEELVFLRINSNISTGGDSIDYTDEIMDSYKKIALRAAHAVGAKICGADIIIQDLHAEPDMNNHGVIELNFNPALHIHNFPFKGKNRHAEKKVLDLLGF